MSKTSNESWVLYDPDNIEIDSKKKLFRRPNGEPTDDINEAQVYGSEAEANAVGDNEPDAWEARPITDFLPSD